MPSRCLFYPVAVRLPYIENRVRFFFFLNVTNNVEVSRLVAAREGGRGMDVNFCPKKEGKGKAWKLSLGNITGGEKRKARERRKTN